MHNSNFFLFKKKLKKIKLKVTTSKPVFSFLKIKEEFISYTLMEYLEFIRIDFLGNIVLIHSMAGQASCALQ